MFDDGHGPPLQVLLQVLGLLTRLQRQYAQLRLQRARFRLASDIAPQQSAPPALLLPDLRRVQDLLIAEALERTNGNQSVAAKMLQISRQALSRRLRVIRLNDGNETP